MTSDAPRRPRPAATVTPCVDGPLLLRGDYELLTPEGERIEPGRRTVALCRCGRSAIKPFCDGTHDSTRFRASGDRERPPGR
ncbi:CDGSH iron-sulfur domain-containing protein [Actinoalloteichus sp. AHMU CJ021]|uniref:Zn-finger domain of CDGSH type-containing protein n=1 Tax=Actinoalloteichus caeruleus DSM 43889 TaxID=1120930 RepID=A0ABT1JGK3_ACTCY|nr:CDGSH iron-sulfur domain-containing protein [Actinoalloteichus caeruleus]AUS77695.1 CDGSH iron-sulfur domain-containing protein [Actinoalloteichus sp. AHMU CJ021]MCP2331612.1 Zn-finger domain of CDGSH type-containing protein [Actinoalloteichus caeruleus DSM 43889]